MRTRRSKRWRRRRFENLTQFEQFQFSRALETAWALVAAVNKYIVENEPWALGEKQDEDSRSRLATVLIHGGRSAAHRDRAWLIQ
jgi:methionyl-tRNA synthetase